jgi:hypothetical protein
VPALHLFPNVSQLLSDSGSSRRRVGSCGAKTMNGSQVGLRCKRCPSFRDEQVAVGLRQIDEVTDAVAGQVDAVDGVCEFVGQPNLHTRSTTNVTQRVGVSVVYPIDAGFQPLW